jgi:hypothetical protein
MPPLQAQIVQVCLTAARLALTTIPLEWALPPALQRHRDTLVYSHALCSGGPWGPAAGRDADCKQLNPTLELPPTVELDMAAAWGAPCLPVPASSLRRAFDLSMQAGKQGHASWPRR